MRKRKFYSAWILAILAFCALLVSHSRSHAASPRSPLPMPIPPYQVYGLVRINNNFVPAGTLVSAWCGGVKYVEDATVDYNFETWYKLDVPGDDPLTLAIKEGCSSGEVISFKIASDDADQTLPWSEGFPIQLDLSINNLTSVYLPVVMR